MRTSVARRLIGAIKMGAKRVEKKAARLEWTVARNALRSVEL
jgi:hypothetical protein